VSDVNHLTLQRPGHEKICMQVEVIQVGACTLLRHGQGEAGLELALLFAKALSDTDPDG
jgi:hypothetical protein